MHTYLNKFEKDCNSRLPHLSDELRGCMYKGAGRMEKLSLGLESWTSYMSHVRLTIKHRHCGAIIEDGCVKNVCLVHENCVKIVLVEIILILRKSKYAMSGVDVKINYGQIFLHNYLITPCTLEVGEFYLFIYLYNYRLHAYKSPM